VRKWLLSLVDLSSSLVDLSSSLVDLSSTILVLPFLKYSSRTMKLKNQHNSKDTCHASKRHSVITRTAQWSQWSYFVLSNNRSLHSHGMENQDWIAASKFALSQSRARIPHCCSVSPSSNRWVAPGTISSRPLGSWDRAQLFISITWKGYQKHVKMHDVKSNEVPIWVGLHKPSICCRACFRTHLVVQTPNN
jgi:hypothetical protein